MSNAGILTIGVLALIAALVISAVITALAPYAATFIVVVGVCLYMSRDKTEEPPTTTRLPTEIPPE